MNTTLSKYLILIFCLGVITKAYSQAYRFKNYSVDNGVTQPYVYSICQDKNGYLWIGTGEGFCKFDGIKFKTFYTVEGLSDNFITTTYKDKSRNLWIGHNQGSITFFDGKNFKSINTSGFAKSPVTAIVGDNKGDVWCATQNDGVFRINKNFAVDVFKLEFDQENIFSLAIHKNNQLLVGTANGLLLYTLEGEKREPAFIQKIESIPETKVNCIVKKNNSTSFWIGTIDNGAFLLTPTPQKNQPFKANPISEKEEFRELNVQSIFEDKLSNLWLATFGNGVAKLVISKNTLTFEETIFFNEENGLGNNYTKTIYADHEDNIWVGTYGTGAVMLTDNFFTFYSNSSTIYSNNISSILIDDDVKWFGTANGLIKIDLKLKEKWRFYNSKNGFVEDRITAIYKKDSLTMILGTEKNGAYLFDVKKERFSKIDLSSDALSASINHITGRNSVLYIATKNGIFKIDDDKKIKHHLTTESGLPHNNINHLFLDQSNTLWVATHSNFITTIRQDGKINHQKIYNGSDLLNVTGILQDNKKQMWLTTFGNGVFKISNDSITKITTENGLKSNYCYAITTDASSNKWIGHRGGVSRILNERNLISRYDKNEGIEGDCNYNAFYVDELGNAWLGTTKGVVKFDPHKDKKNLIPPIINIVSIRVNDKELDSIKNISLDYDNYKIRFDFIGISFKANSNITYQYKLEGYDADWSDKTENNFVQYGKITEGNYIFLIRAFNNDGVSNEIPASIQISIAAPFWKKIWFIVLCIIVVLYGFYLIVKIRERNHRIFQAQLQKALNEKTREVVAQKDEIERKNKDITDSIRYAKRIQDAILPGINKLKDIFPGSFIFYQPRDIVSGDFYWFEVYGNKLIIACADATGHGVPGAFMSMIGNTLLKDIASRTEVTSPAHALAALDLEIKILLHQFEDDDDQTSDSIDLVICEIDIETLMVRTCSTKRPIFVSKGNELLTLKKDITDTQEYETKDIQLSRGDILYMFTDGYPDQFGGTDGKKLKAANIKTLLEEIKLLPPSKQAMIVDRYFNRWKEGHEQVDDVLFIGIQL
ncbi:MAG: SpoIIE family protein phosphatase [Bacteroidia bacterium]|nr:SpoIIE family protein phosphatase [Bacteroidia bacterium]